MISGPITTRPHATELSTYPQVIHTDNLPFSKGLDSYPRIGYNDRMSNKNATGTSPVRTPKSRKGPKPIRTVAELREQLLADAVTREMRKIDRKIAVEERKRRIAHQRANDATANLDRLSRLRSEFLREAGIKA